VVHRRRADELIEAFTWIASVFPILVWCSESEHHQELTMVVALLMTNMPRCR